MSGMDGRMGEEEARSRGAFAIGHNARGSWGALLADEKLLVIELVENG